MSQYIITIVPVEDDGEQITGPVAQTVVRLDTGDGHPVVRELTVRAPQSAGLTGELPYVDFDALLRAFVPPQDRERGRSAGSGGRPEQGVGPVPAATAVTPAAAPPAPPRPARRPAEPERLSRLKSGRAYRRAPDAADLEAIYEQVGTISRVAEHFDVPVHTAQGWISRLRRKHGTEVSAG
ncbi:hypothetical protein [Micromonospora humi]|uniref:Uncharacterized protein n=1 Tax=Micromonospora humi TaxID=745366 RepID=A0A1C5H022_9ACTN|nr:hypothetical protein [Micromonospora humi]SCG39338.1 hypothetical protein GA0070213_10299 [Micromonospora humi]